MTDKFREMLAQAAWERAKGALREFTVLQGHRDPQPPPKTKLEWDAHHARWVALRDHVEAFIKATEHEGLHE